MNPNLEVTLHGEDREYRLDCRSFNSMCRVEEATDRTFWEVVQELSRKRPRAITIRRFLAAVLVDPPQPPIEEVGDILKDIGGVDVIRLAAQSAARTVKRTLKKMEVN